MFINFETQKWILLFIPALKNTKKEKVLFCVLFWFCLFEGGAPFPLLGLWVLLGLFLRMYTGWCEKRYLGEKAASMLCFASVHVKTIEKAHGLMSLLSCMPGVCGTLVVPEITRQGLPSLNTHLFLYWKERLLLILIVPTKGFLSPWLTSTVHKYASNKTGSFSRQKSTAVEGTITQ